MFGWLSWAASLASSMNRLMKSVLPVMYGRIFLIATVFWNPSTPRMRAFHTSAMPPTAMRSSSVYCPKVSPAGSGASRGTIWMRWVASGLSPPGSTLPAGAGGGGATRGAPAAEEAVDPAAAGGAAGREGGAGAWAASPGREDGSILRPAFAISSISDIAIAPVIRRRTPVDSAAAGGDGGGPAGGGAAGDAPAGDEGAGRAGAGTAGVAAGTEDAGGAAATGTAGAVGLAGAAEAAGGAGLSATAAGMGLAGAVGDMEAGGAAAAGWA